MFGFPIAQLSYAATGLSFGLLVLYLIVRWRVVSPNPLLLLACILTSAWGILISWEATSSILGNLLSASETLRAAAWILFLSSLLFQFWRQNNSLSYTFVLSMTMALVFTLQIFIDVGVLRIFDIQIQGAALQTLLVQAYIFGRLVVAIAGLALIENLYRSTEKLEKWKLRPLGLGLGGFFAYDIVLYAEGLLFTSLDPDLFAARGFITAMIAPLIYVSAKRINRWTFDVILTRRAVFHSLSLLITGCYLIFMAGAGWALARFGGNWGAVLQIAFLCAAAGFLAYLFVSDGARAKARVSLAKYFRRYKYDYREVWIKFIRRIDSKELDASLESRVIDGVCEIVDSQGGRLYLRDSDGQLSLADASNFRSELLPSVLDISSMEDLLVQQGWIIDLNDLRNGNGQYGSVVLPQWAQKEVQAWLIIPLIRDHFIGCIITRQSRASRQLDWEDHDLLKTIGMQAASYLAEQRSQAALSEAEQFDAFNRRFAFIMHDLKNLVSQLSLLSRNVERHGSDPEFQKDMAETLQSSVAKINMLLARLHQAPDSEQSLQAVNIGAILRGVVQAKKPAHGALSLTSPDTLMATADPHRLEQVITHLVQNAIDASRGDDQIDLSSRESDGTVIIEIADSGEGMSADFLQKQLFKPFASTKAAGFGIGAYEARELTRQMQGSLSVTSELGKGTQFVLKFPKSGGGLNQGAETAPSDRSTHLSHG
ncbi:MAG: XrtA/PEP-CTERM system histidine kinase PrsK [Pseudomonadota bacterium]